MNNKRSNEYLLNNYLEKDFQAMLFPLNLMQCVAFQQKYRIFHGFITPNACQRFDEAMVDVEAACAILLGNADCFTDIRRLCKNVIRVSSCARAAGGLRAGGVVAVDAALPLRLLQLIATYTVVLLQFALL
ncbi:uncharacterized protein [Choristoneura fumiferana]|uniref:uncharacterized protein n=1 Tax=Choristoneura fumiferana TaxID=7141 RepID=UPI003D15CEF1